MFFEVDPVALHIHERVSAQAIVRTMQREDTQRDLFADPQLPYQKTIEFYQHDVDWANRLILGDSVQVMASLARRENLAGKVQMVYMDPPYGIKFASNFQSEVGQKNVKEKEDYLAREPEVVKAYRDTWNLGTHSYMSYLRDRLVASRELLSETGSIFVQISDENEHRVRCLMDEVFGADNFVSLIHFRKKTMPFGTRYIEQMGDFIVWYAKNKNTAKYFSLTKPANIEGEFHHCWYEMPNGSCHRMDKKQINNHELLPRDARVYRLKRQNLNNNNAARYILSAEVLLSNLLEG